MEVISISILFEVTRLMTSSRKWFRLKKKRGPRAESWGLHHLEVGTTKRNQQTRLKQSNEKYRKKSR